MIDYKIVFGSAALLAGAYQYFPYLWDVWRNKTKPHAFSWFAWGLPTIVVFFAQVSKVGGAGTWVTGFSGLVCTVIFVLALFKGEKDIRILDWISFAFCLAGIALWAITTDPLWAVVLATSVDLIGFVPTVRKSIEKPGEETMGTYATGGFKWILSIIALTTFDLTTLIYPVAMIVANWGFVLFLRSRRATLSAI